MNARMKRLMLTGLVLTAAALAVAQYKADTNVYARDEQELRKVDRQWTEALEKEDAAALEKILADDYTMVDAVGISVSRQETIDQVRSGALKFDMFSASEIKARVFQGGGVLTGRVTTKGKYKDEDISGDYRFVDVYEFRKGAWKPVYTQLTKLKPAK